MSRPQTDLDLYQDFIRPRLWIKALDKAVEARKFLRITSITLALDSVTFWNAKKWFFRVRMTDSTPTFLHWSMTFLQSDLKTDVRRRFRIAYATYLQSSKPIAIVDMEYSLWLIRELVSKAPSETVKGNLKNDVNASPQHLIFGVSDRPWHRL
jgi:hypothetical protein